MIVTRSALRTTVYTVLILSVFPLFCLEIMVGQQFANAFSFSYFPQIAAGYAAMILIIEFVGIPLRAKLTHSSAGGLFAYALVMGAVLAGSITAIIIDYKYYNFENYSRYNFFIQYLVEPLGYVGAYGLIPAFVIGSIGSAILRSTSKKTGE